VTSALTMTAVLAAINAAVTPQAYDADKVPSARPAEYVAVNLTRMFGGVRRSDGRFSETGYRLSVEAVSQVSLANVRKSLDDARAGIEFLRVVVGGVESTPILFESATLPATKDGWSSARQFYTFVV
jgi:hypothetical protein